MESARSRSYQIFLFISLTASILHLLYKEIFVAHLANPLAEATTVLMFASALFLLQRQRTGISLNMVFGIPLLTYLYYQADFSTISPDSFTMYYTVAWYLAGLFVLALWAPFGSRYIFLFLAGWLSLSYHGYEAGALEHFFSGNQVFISNPFLIWTVIFILLSLLRIRYDKAFGQILNRCSYNEQLYMDFFFRVKLPVVRLRAVRDGESNVLRLEIEQINPAFETAFKTSAAEAKDLELHFYFNLLFRNQTDWNHLFFLDSKGQSEMYVPSIDKWFSVNIFWFSSSNCFCVFNDISRGKKELAELKETKARYLALLEAIPDIFFVIDKDGIFQDVVFKGQENFLSDTSEVIGNSIFRVGFSELMAGKILRCIQKSIQDDTIETIEYSLEARGGSLLYEMRLARLDEQSVICISRDITRRKKAEFELDAARIKAEEADVLKSKFLANLSHDIRTPVNIIVSLSKLLAEPSLSEFEKGEIIHDVQQQGDSLLQIIENTIHLSKIETNSLEVSTSYTNIHRLLRELYLHFYPLLPDHRELQLILHTEIAHGEVGFETDPVLLKETLFRLIDNAVRFTPAGTVTFGYTTAIGNRVEFFVSDTGPGIPESEMENIFLRFYVIEADRQAMKCGPGLGLPIAQHFVALIGGELKVDSSPGKGSRFWFRLPLRNQKGFLRVV